MRTADTETLIAELAGETTSVRPLAQPWKRAGRWLGIAVPSALALIIIMSAHDDWTTRLLLPRVLSEEAFALATGILASIAAFASVVPGYDRRVLLLPLAPLVLWLGAMGQGSVREWLQLTSRGFSLQSEWVCLPGTLMAGAVPAITMAGMLRRGAPLTPRLSALLGGLASAGLGNLGVCVTHHAYANVLVLLWHVGIVTALTGLAATAGTHLLNWKSAIGRVRLVFPQ